MHRTQREAEANCIGRTGWRVWAYDLGRRAGSTAQPKWFVTAPVGTFRAAYALLTDRDKHAYEHIDGKCNVFFDLECTGEDVAAGDGMAQQVADTARQALEELGMTSGVSLRVDILAADSEYDDKFSRHLVLVASCAESGRPVLLGGPREAGAIAAQVAARVGDAARVIDLGVYRPRRLLRLFGSAKKTTPGLESPLLFNAARSTVSEAAAGLALVVPDTASPMVLTVGQAPSSRSQEGSLGEPSRDVTGAPHRSSGLPLVARGGPAPVLSGGAWRGAYAHLTGMPLLDLPLLPHPRVLTRLCGRGMPPAPFVELGLWGAAELLRLGCSGVARWEFAASEWPLEQLFHLTGKGGRCAHVGRAHKQGQNIILSIDLLNLLAWQRCWDRTCIVRLGGGYRKARTLVGNVPPSVLPSKLPCKS